LQSPSQTGTDQGRHGPLGPKFQPADKANAIADCLEKQFTPHKLFDKNHERHVKARVQALLEAEDNDPPPRKSKTMWFIEINKFIEIE
jgi:hypothetical protein